MFTSVAFSGQAYPSMLDMGLSLRLFLSVQHLWVCIYQSGLTILCFHPVLTEVCFWLAVSLPVPVYGSTTPVSLPVLICQSLFVCQPVPTCLPVGLHILIWRHESIYLWLCLYGGGGVQSPRSVWLFVTSRTAARQASLSLTISWSLPKFTSIASVTPSSHLIPLLLPSIFASNRNFSN